MTRILIKGNIEARRFVSTMRRDTARLLTESDRDKHFDMVIDAGGRTLDIESLSVLNEDIEIFVDGSCAALGYEVNTEG